MFDLFKPKGKAAVDKAVQLYQAGQKAEALEMALRGGKTGAPEGWGVAAGLYLEMGRYQDCLNAAETALGSALPDVQKAAAWNAKGQALAAQGKLPEARKCFPPCLVQTVQALNLACVLAWRGAPDAPPADSIMLGNTGIKAWFPAEPRLKEANSILQYSLVSPEYSYLVAREQPIPTAADPKESLMSFLRDVVQAPPFEVVKLELKPPFLSYGAWDGESLQIGRLWMSGVHARVTVRELRDGANVEPGRFLASIQIVH